MKIAVVSPNLPPMPWPCGAADFAQLLARRLAAGGDEVTILTSNPRAEETTGAATTIETGRWGLGHVCRVARVLARGGFDVVDLQYEPAMYGHRGACLLLPWLARAGAAFVLTLHSEELPRGGRPWRLAQLAAFDGFAVYSERLERVFVDRAPRSKAVARAAFPANIVRGAAVDLEQLVARLRQRHLGDEQLLVYFGHVAAGRGIEAMLDGFAQARRGGLRARLLLVGQFTPQSDPYHRELLARLRACTLDEVVDFAGRLDDASVSALLAAADLCVLPFPEGASGKNGSLSAAIEHRLPVLTTRGAATEAELCRSGALELVSPGDATALGAALTRIARPEVLDAMRARAAELAALRSWDGYVATRRALYARVCRVPTKGRQSGAGLAARDAHSSSAAPQDDAARGTGEAPC